MMEWISVDDKMPDDEIVLAYHKNVGHDVIFCTGEEWYLPDDWQEINPTHWTPLPPPPRDNK